MMRDEHHHERHVHSRHSTMCVNSSTESGPLNSTLKPRTARYAWIQAMLLRFHYPQLGKAEKGLLLDFLQKVSGYSRIQVKRLIQRYLARPASSSGGSGPSRGFAASIRWRIFDSWRRLMKWHGTLSGPATKKLCERAWMTIRTVRVPPVGGHLRELPVCPTARLQLPTMFASTLTRPVSTGLPSRRTPATPAQCGQPGYLRVDTVHQGDFDGVKGIYHINAVDEVTQFEIVDHTEFMVPAG